jgi:hypothetical protein
MMSSFDVMIRFLARSRVGTRLGSSRCAAIRSYAAASGWLPIAAGTLLCEMFVN